MQGLLREGSWKDGWIKWGHEVNVHDKGLECGYELVRMVVVNKETVVIVR